MKPPCNQVTSSQVELRQADLWVWLQGAKLSVLAAVRDPRVKAVALLDPVDNTVYAPLGPG